MKNQKKLVLPMLLVLCLGLLCSCASVSPSIKIASTSIYGKVESKGANDLIISLVATDSPNQSRPGGSGSMPPEGMPGGSGSMPPEGMPGGSGSMPPEGAPQTSGTLPDGMGFKPDAPQGSDSGFTDESDSIKDNGRRNPSFVQTDTIITLYLNSNIKFVRENADGSTSECALSDIKAGAVIKVSFDNDGNISEIRLLDSLSANTEK